MLGSRTDGWLLCSVFICLYWVLTHLYWVLASFALGLLVLFVFVALLLGSGFLLHWVHRSKVSASVFGALVAAEGSGLLASAQPLGCALALLLGVCGALVRGGKHRGSLA